MNITNEMAEAALDALDDACIGFNRSNPRASVHWKGFTRDDRVAAVRAALSAAIALMRGQSWQPIETAPRDGTAVFAFWGRDTRQDERSFAVTLFRDGEWRNPDNTDDWYGEPTHWQPLVPPKTGAR